MENPETLELVNMLISEGTIEILKFLEDGGLRQFGDVRNLINPRTNKAFSQTTLSNRLRELVKCGILEQQILAREKGRSTIGYKITQNGLRTLEVARKFERALEKVLKK